MYICKSAKTFPTILLMVSNFGGRLFREQIAECAQVLSKTLV